ncbi:predicted protein [Sclerotinia sclerotiorum 1980 UF-70]|uniref:Uncharacterized protein n=1 Tax=Sclerotinia sclerotiorum (strain ATCC 18683 / 1980 / Ss-1) TaxID=665079 RepID=A7F248_SCLS1|nr:predicted protein [Sclerotinia sclerotiorum 1980 UF-70]EDN95790.1 predicted protein [Sclerotinia sclerotiorum 1980 UF-70]
MAIHPFHYRIDFNSAIFRHLVLIFVGVAFDARISVTNITILSGLVDQKCEIFKQIWMVWDDKTGLGKASCKGNIGGGITLSDAIYIVLLWGLDGYPLKQQHLLFLNASEKMKQKILDITHHGRGEITSSALVASTSIVLRECDENETERSKLGTQSRECVDQAWIALASWLIIHPSVVHHPSFIVCSPWSIIRGCLGDSGFATVATYLIYHKNSTKNSDPIKMSRVRCGVNREINLHRVLV